MAQESDEPLHKISCCLPSADYGGNGMEEKSFVAQHDAEEAVREMPAH